MNSLETGGKYISLPVAVWALPGTTVVTPLPIVQAYLQNSATLTPTSCQKVALNSELFLQQRQVWEELQAYGTGM